MINKQLSSLENRVLFVLIVVLCVTPKAALCPKKDGHGKVFAEISI